MFFAVTSGFAIRPQMKPSETLTLTPLKPSVIVTLTPLMLQVIQVMISEHEAEIQMKSLETASIFSGSVIVLAMQLFVTWHH